ncbi:ribosome maturation protein SBDS, putative [Plasmodium yoelii]|uniref:Ribosome maturation protein SBDS n=2 Tax=Plasmodium yoelii TaxID=5861 RepID=A0AAF0B5A3_PLAYO|nr:ribosome maturation protein SBDS, putative [Plasmodium yoelii]WBY58124.1 ribosome maturation protein SBDS [Plasmodium yoelii yoelii]CDU85170.1 ribosome maturation protein SBDS, putative [Plasmodium yoelii]VTZ79065.1 ribosome maturation protein SBDS, putative [Plasmodium yoelii]|eukprot:XP_022813382.1 ribosome maturation protein SBDS, putative [Plasmodium yoelii]
MGALFQPINQVKFTNVAIVKYKHKGNKFEIACYKNKIIDWKNGNELNIDDVLQSHLIFTNISKGEIAKKSQLNSCFNSDDNYEICKTILEKGTLQISNRERAILKEKMYKDIIEMLHEMSVNPQTGYPLSTNMIESMIKNVGYSINIDDSTKKQALKVFELLHKEYEDVIQRAFMRIQIICDDFIKNDVIKLLNDNNAIIEEDKMTNNLKREDELNQNCDNIHKENMSNHDMKNDEINNLKDQKQSNLSSSIQLNNSENDPKQNNHNFSYNNKTGIDNETVNGTSNDIFDDTKDKDQDQVNGDNCQDTMNKNNFDDDPNNNTTSTHKKGTSNNEHSETSEEKLDSKKNKKNQDSFPIDNEKTNKEKFADNSKIKTKQKINKHNVERKGDNLQTYKIVFLCYPSLYRCIDEFTKKNKKNCSSKILSNNVKVATSNKKKKNDSPTIPKESDNTNKKKEERKNKNTNDKNKKNSISKKEHNDSKGNNTYMKNSNDSESSVNDKISKNNNYITNKNEQSKNQNSKNNGINNNRISNQTDDKIIQNSTKEKPSIGINNNDKTTGMIMCTSCLTQIEKNNYKLHCRSDFHVYNVKRKYKKLPPITLEEYIEIDFDVSHFHVDM